LWFQRLQLLIDGLPARTMIYPGDQLENPVKLGLDSSVYVPADNLTVVDLKGTSNLKRYTPYYGTSVLAHGCATVPQNVFAPWLFIKWILHGAG
jgi:hypothetical protein